MSLPSWTLALVVLSGLLSLAEARQQSGIHRAVAIVCAVAASAFLYFLLFPPLQQDRGRGLAVITAGATPAQIDALPAGLTRVALPGAPVAADTAQAPDLATALRRLPDVSTLHVVGDGLGAADRDAVRGRALQFDAAPLPRGIVALQWPPHIRAGHSVELRGRVQQGAGAQLALREPGNPQPRLERADAQGEFRFRILARQPATLRYELQLLSPGGEAEQSLQLPLQIESGTPLRLLLWSGGPDPDLKYLQRWALDAGHTVEARTSLSRGLAQQRGEAGLDAASLAETDVLVIDDRAWAQLDKSTRARVLAAVDDGLGLLLRLGAASAALAAELRGLGLDLATAEIDTTLQLPHQVGEAALQRLPLQAKSGVATLARAADGRELGVYTGRGLGRIGAWWLQGTQSLVTSGQDALHDAAWATALDALARPRQPRDADIPAWIWRGERSLLCAGDAALTVEPEDGSRIALVGQHRDDERWCAGYWPRQSGWQLLHAGEQQQPLLVRDPDQAPSLYRAQRQEQTRALAGPGSAQSLQRTLPGARWPWFLAWLLPSAALWWLQRRRSRGPQT